MKETKRTGSANGVRGCLLRSMEDGLPFFRVYDSEHNFRDYLVTHHDVDVVIDDATAWFYESDGELYLDYSPDSMEPAEDTLSVYNDERLTSRFDKGAVE